MTEWRFHQGQGTAAAAKRILIEKHGNRCQDPTCAWDFSKKEIVVQLDHIDGNPDNNDPTNLRLLCPNCHSETPTWGMKNKREGEPLSSDSRNVYRRNYRMEK